MTRKVCPRCGRAHTVNAYAAKYWGIQSKLDGKLICEECAWEELYKRMFSDVEANDAHGKMDGGTTQQESSTQA